MYIVRTFAITTYSVFIFFSGYHIWAHDITEKSNEFYDLALMFALTIDKTFCRVRLDCFFFLSSCHRHMSSFRLRLFYSIPRVAAWRPDGRRRAIVARRFRKKARYGRKKEIHARRYKRVLCVYGHVRFPRPFFACFEFLIRENSSMKFAPFLSDAFLSIRMKTVTIRRLENPRTRSSIEKQIQSSPLNYTECPLQYRKKESDNSLVA